MTSRKVHREKPYDLFDFFHVDQNAWPYEPEIDKLVMELINPEDRERVPGVDVAVRRNQQVVHVRCYGYANLETGARITPDTIFDLGSLSKQFTAIATLDLLNKKKISLNDPLSKFFKELLFKLKSCDACFFDPVDIIVRRPRFVWVCKAAKSRWYSCLC